MISIPSATVVLTGLFFCLRSSFSWCMCRSPFGGLLFFFGVGCVPLLDSLGDGAVDLLHFQLAHLAVGFFDGLFCSIGAVGFVAEEAVGLHDIADGVVDVLHGLFQDGRFAFAPGAGEVVAAGHIEIGVAESRVGL